MSQEAINKGSRAARRSRRLGPEPSCLRCGYDNPDALSRESDGVRCYECQQMARKAATIERHHPLGRKNDPFTIPTPGNLHRALSDAQLDHPESICTGVTADPLLWLAAAIRGLHDHLAWWVERLEVVAAFLIAVSAWIRSMGAVTDLGSFPTLFGRGMQ